MRRLVPLFLLVLSSAQAHVGSPDVFYEGDAGPYRLLVAIRPPPVIPGVAEIEVRAAAADVREVKIVPLPLTGAGARFAPTPDVAQRSKDDPQFFTGSLWMMSPGSWQVRVSADGPRGPGQLSVPVPALATRTATMQRTIGAVLFGMMIFLVVGVVSIVGAGVREAQLPPGGSPTPALRRKSIRVMTVTAVLVAALIYLGNRWWNAEAREYGGNVYRPVQASAALRNGSLVLRLEDTGWIPRLQRLDDLIPDHNHIMHLFLIREPGMDRMWHLHPDQTDTGTFSLPAPSIPAGKYRLFADIVHATGLPETAVTEIELPGISGRPLAGDDSEAAAPPVSQADFNRTEWPLPDGGRIVWLRDGAPLISKRATWFRFRVEDKGGRPSTQMELYMGMPGHAEFIRNDFSVFAHVHPSGSAPMAAAMLAQTGMDMGSMHAAQARLPAEVSFPYGFPRPGDYRIFAQFKRGGRVETGVFDARVAH